MGARLYINTTVVPTLNELGHSVNSRWLQGNHTEKAISAENDIELNYFRKKFAEEDYEDIDKCDALLHFADPYGNRSGRGKYIEVGFAYARNKKIYVVGENCDESVFYFTPGIERYKSFYEFTLSLKKMLQVCDMLQSTLWMLSNKYR